VDSISSSAPLLLLGSVGSCMRTGTFPSTPSLLPGAPRPSCWLCLLRPCLVPQIHHKLHYTKIRFSITSKYRHMHGVLNVDEIKN
jgi:hypothetical protein